MKRKMMEELIHWRNQKKDRLPLLIHGARQVGKTHLMKQLGVEEFKNVVYINFEMDQNISEYFQSNIHPDYLIQVFEKYYHTTIVPDETLLILDEVQLCERALTSLKYFAEDAPEYHVVAAGSLLGVAIKRKEFSFPVGKVQLMNLYPMDFEEYLWAKGKMMLADTIREHFNEDRAMSDAMHQDAMKEYIDYCIVGGMPAAILAECTKESVLTQAEIRQMLLDSYIADMTKYAEPSEAVKIFGAYDSLPTQLAKDSKKFQYKLIKSGARASQYGESIDWLIRSGIVHKCMKCTQGFMPLSAFRDLTAFKLYYGDTGIMSARAQMNQQRMLSAESEHFRGIFAENYVACALRSNGYELFYWESDGTAEVDFLIIKEDHVIPIECKAGDHVKAKSLMVYREKYHPVYSVRISARNFGMKDGIKSVPLYAVFCI